jgi:hypothetical protein
MRARAKVMIPHLGVAVERARAAVAEKLLAAGSQVGGQGWLLKT